MISEAVSSVITDESFQIPSPSASAAISTATAMSHYISDKANVEVLEKFSTTLFVMFKGCLNSKYKGEYEQQKI